MNECIIVFHSQNKQNFLVDLILSFETKETRKKIYFQFVVPENNPSSTLVKVAQEIIVLNKAVNGAESLRTFEVLN